MKDKKNKLIKILIPLNIIIISIIAVIGGLLGALGGSTNKLYRRLGIPTLLAFLGFLFKNPNSLYIYLWTLIMYIGYGIPTIDGKGSYLGRFWFWIFKGNELKTNIVTRGTLGVLYSIALIIIGVLSHNINLLLITIPLTLGSVIVFGAVLKLGVVTLFKKQLLLNELFTYTGLTLAGLLQLIIK